MFESEKLINRIMVNGASVPLAINTASNDLIAYYTKTLEVLDDSSGVYTSGIEWGQFQNQSHLKYVNLPVASGEIGGVAFNGCYSLSRFIMPNCTSIYNGTFQNCSSLESIDFPKCTLLSSSAFYNCSKLSYVNMPLLSISKSVDAAFQGCSALETINAPLLSVLGSYTFSGCSALKNCNIDWSNITSIPYYCFYGCGLERVDIPNASRIMGYAFANCRALSEINASNVTSIGGNTFSGCTALRNVIVNTSAITSLPSSCFQSCISLEVVSFPNVVSIYESALFGCSGLRIVNLPKMSSFSKGGYDKSDVFDGCESLEEVYLPNLSSSAYYLGLEGKSALRVINLDNCTDGIYLQNCTSLESVSFPKAYTGSFYGCTSLKTVNMPLCRVLYNYAFRNCTALTSISVPELKELREYSIFENCTSLRLISLPKCSYISGSSMFSNCSNLSMFVIGTGYSSVCVLSTFRTFDSSPIEYSSYLGYYGSIYVPASLVDAYKTATNWAYYSNRITSIDNLPTT